MPKYKVKYYFDGQGECVIDAKSKKEAEAKFYDGDYSQDGEWGEQYTINEIEKA